MLIPNQRKSCVENCARSTSSFQAQSPLSSLCNVYLLCEAIVFHFQNDHGSPVISSHSLKKTKKKQLYWCRWKSWVYTQLIFKYICSHIIQAVCKSLLFQFHAASGKNRNLIYTILNGFGGWTSLVLKQKVILTLK